MLPSEQELTNATKRKCLQCDLVIVPPVGHSSSRLIAAALAGFCSVDCHWEKSHELVRDGKAWWRK